MSNRMYGMSRLLIDEPPLQVLPSLAAAIGLNEAIFLQQLHYWLLLTRHEYDGRVWVYNTYDGWREQFPFWSTPTIRRVIANLRDANLIITTDAYNRKSFDNTLWYTIEYDALSAISDRPSDQNDQTMRSKRSDHVINMIMPIPETTTETTTETTNRELAAAPQTDPPAAKKKSKRDPESDPNAQHPAVQAYRDVFLRYPAKAKMKAIAEANPNIGNWVRACRAWNLEPFNPDNIAGILDWAENPNKITNRTKGPTHTSNNKRTTKLTARATEVDNGDDSSDNQLTPEEKERYRAEKRAREAARRAAESGGVSDSGAASTHSH